MSLATGKLFQIKVSVLLLLTMHECEAAEMAYTRKTQPTGALSELNLTHWICPTMVTVFSFSQPDLPHLFSYLSHI